MLVTSLVRFDSIEQLLQLVFFALKMKHFSLFLYICIFFVYLYRYFRSSFDDLPYLVTRTCDELSDITKITIGTKYPFYKQWKLCSSINLRDFLSEPPGKDQVKIHKRSAKMFRY